MKNLLYKEFRLAIHPSVYVFFLLSALLLVPSYPYYVSFFYLTLGVFLTFKTNRAENDIFYSALLPVRKGDVVRARARRGAFGACQHSHRRPVRGSLRENQSRGREQCRN